MTGTFFVEKRLFVSFYVIIVKILGILCIILYDSGRERGIAEGNTNFYFERNHLLCIYLLLVLKFYSGYLLLQD